MLKQGFQAVEYYPIGLLDLLYLVSEQVAAGYELLSHPLTGSIRPDITPYKSILLSEKPGKYSKESAQLIEHAIEYAQELYRQRAKPLSACWPEEAKQDFQCVDLSIILQALEVAQCSL